MTDSAITKTTAKGGGVKLAVVYVTCLFFIWALVTNLLDPLLKTFKTVFTLSPVEASLTGFAFFIAYGIMSLPSAAMAMKQPATMPPRPTITERA